MHGRVRDHKVGDRLIVDTELHGQLRNRQNFAVSQLKIGIGNFLAIQLRNLARVLMPPIYS